MAGYIEATRLLRRSNLRAMSLAFRGEVRGYDPPTEPDPALVELTERPFESVGETADRLAELTERLRERSDRRAVFLTIYLRMTRTVHDRIEDGTFADPAWMRDYVVTFANYYRRAFCSFERGNVGAVPDPWRIAFGTAIDGDALLLQDAFLGVNAHINYDLALALNDVGIDPHRAQKRADHRAIDDILARLVDAQQDALAAMYASDVEDIDAVFGRIDESATLLSMTEGRDQAWRIAVITTDVGLPPVASFARWVLRATATGGALFILGPQPDASHLKTLREIESDGVGIDTLLQQMTDRIDEIV